MKERKCDECHRVAATRKPVNLCKPCLRRRIANENPMGQPLSDQRGRKEVVTPQALGGAPKVPEDEVEEWLHDDE